jgi:hypothetical protein
VLCAAYSVRQSSQSDCESVPCGGISGDNKGTFTSKAEDTQRRAAALASYVSGLAATPSVWFSTAMHSFVGHGSSSGA